MKTHENLKEGIMQVKGVRLYGVDDIRLEEFELPEIKDDEILVKVVSDSICMSTWKTVKQGAGHKRVPNDVADHPVLVGHEFAGDIVKVGKKWQDQFKPGQKFAQHPGQMESPGYSYQYCGGAATYCIFPNDIIEKGCVWTFEGDSYFDASVAEPMCCVISGYHTNYHTVPGSYEHVMGTKEGGNILILGGCGPMGLGAVSYALAFENKPKRVVVTDISDDRVERAKQVISIEDAKAAGVELHYVNTAAMEDQEKELMDITEGHGYDDVFVYVPITGVAELGNKLLAYDGCMNLFAGPTDPKFSANMNLYDCHYSRTKILGSTGGTIEDMKEAINKAASKEIKPAVMITHIGGIDAVAETTKNLPDIPGGKKLTYMQFDMPLTAIDDFRKLGETDPLYAKLADACDKHNGLWNAEAEKILFDHFGA